MPQLNVIALSMILIGLAIVGWQGRAKSCPRHRPWIGAVAWFLAALNLIGGISLLMG